MKKLVYILFISVLVNSSCEEAEEPIIVDQTGTLTAKIDSLNSFVINLSKSTIDTSDYDGTKIINIEAMDNGSNTLLIYIPSRDTGMFKLAQGVESTIRYITKQGIMYRGKSGNIHITKSDIINKKLSGTFDAKLLQTGSNDTIYVTDGVFVDLPLPKKQ